MDKKTESLLNKFFRGDVMALSRLISLVENGDDSGSGIWGKIFPRVGRAYRIGVTGPPGVGKSTLIDKLVPLFRRGGQTVGVIAVDPTSPFSGGALLGDRVRMPDIGSDPGVFLRSMATRGSLGGLALAAKGVADVLDAFGKDIIIFETVGVGQAELDVAGAADTTLVVLVPESGDGIQAMKAGLMEIADGFVLNKADREGAEGVRLEIETVLKLRPKTDWELKIIPTVAIRNQGIDQTYSLIQEHRAYLHDNHRFEERRRKQRVARVKTMVEEKIKERFWTEDRKARLSEWTAGDVPIDQIIDRLLKT